MSGKWTLRYGSAAVFTAIVIIAAALIANPTLLPTPAFGKANFTIMLTDPPTVPAGTTVLNLTYSNLSLHVTYPNETTEWLPVGASGTVNLFSLVNMTQTLASITIPVGSTVDKIQFGIANVDAEVNGTAYSVTTLSDTLVINVADGYVNQTLSGVLLDFNPTLVQIQATDADGALVDYYVLVPSATAVVVNDLSDAQLGVGTIVKLGEHHRMRLLRVQEEFKKNVTFVSASLKVNGNSTALSVTLKNEGDIAFRIFGVTLHGEFSISQTFRMRFGMHGMSDTWAHPGTIPFRVNGSSLVPLFGSLQEHEEELYHRSHEGPILSSVTLQPGESITLIFDGVIALQAGRDIARYAMAIAPVVDGSYTLRLMGEGFQTYNVIATS